MKRRFLSLAVVIVVDQLGTVTVDALGRFEQRVARRLDQPFRHNPALGEDLGILDDGLPRQIVAILP